MNWKLDTTGNNKPDSIGDVKLYVVINCILNLTSYLFDDVVLLPVKYMRFHKVPSAGDRKSDAEL